MYGIWSDYVDWDLIRKIICLLSWLQEEDEGSDTEGLKDILPGDLLDTDLVNTIMNGDDDITKNEDNLDDIGGKLLSDPLVDMILIEGFEHCSEVSWMTAKDNTDGRR